MVDKHDRRVIKKANARKARGLQGLLARKSAIKRGAGKGSLLEILSERRAHTQPIKNCIPLRDLGDLLGGLYL